MVYLFAAFVVIWLLIFGYVAFIGGRVQGLRQEVEALREELDARPPSDERRDPQAGTPGDE